METLSDRITELMGVRIGMEVAARAAATTAYARQIPMRPPVAASTADSVTNCRTICFFRAPSERRKPISRVRSVTLASMMFMITIPPTTRNTAVKPTATANKFPVSCFHKLMIDSEPTTPKLSSASQGR